MNSLINHLMRYTSKDGSFSIEWNPHRTNYETIEQWSSRFLDELDWVSPEEKERAIREDSMFVLQWYPVSPIGFNYWAASSLEAIADSFPKEVTV